MEGVLARFQFQWCWVSTVLLHLLARKRIPISTVKPKPNPIGGVVLTQFFFFKEVPYIAVVIVLVFRFVILDVAPPQKRNYWQPKGQ